MININISEIIIFGKKLLKICLLHLYIDINTIAIHFCAAKGSYINNDAAPLLLLKNCQDGEDLASSHDLILDRE